MTPKDLMGKKAPLFQLKNQNDEERSNASYKGHWLVLYFYPKDNTPGCTTEAIEFTTLLNKFGSRDAVIAGISPDSVASHQKFIDKQNLKIELLSDSDKQAAEACGVWQLKKMAGREYMGVVRTTFLIDPKGVVKEVWENVKVKEHADTVYTAVCQLAQ
ncbi:MAG: peroxiredoxin [Deltaproteobacteria bacterium]|nr:peroxiredoxin [Deltaproteobacteria bacterium]